MTITCALQRSPSRTDGADLSGFERIDMMELSGKQIDFKPFGVLGLPAPTSAASRPPGGRASTLDGDSLDEDHPPAGRGRVARGGGRRLDPPAPRPLTRPCYYRCASGAGRRSRRLLPPTGSGSRLAPGAPGRTTGPPGGSWGPWCCGGSVRGCPSPEVGPAGNSLTIPRQPERFVATVRRELLDQVIVAPRPICPGAAAGGQRSGG